MVLSLFLVDGREEWGMRNHQMDEDWNQEERYESILSEIIWFQTC